MRVLGTDVVTSLIDAEGDRRAGVVWHTQGSGKSFFMLFFAARGEGVREGEKEKGSCNLVIFDWRMTKGQLAHWPLLV
jgi:hypothetical protein